MNNVINKAFALALLLFHPIFLYSQFKTLTLPINYGFTGVAFINENKGIVTTKNSTLYILQKTDDDFEFIGSNYFATRPNTIVTQPFWLNDSFLMIIYYDVMDRKGIYYSIDNGQNWNVIKEFCCLNFFGKIVKVANDTFYFIRHSDFLGHFGIYRVEVRDGNILLDEKEVFICGYPEFTCINEDTLLFVGDNDSLYYYNYHNDSLSSIKTNLPQGHHLKSIEYGDQGELLTLWKDCIYRSMDKGKNWTLVFERKDLSELKHLAPSMWFVIQKDNDSKYIYWSQDNGETWSKFSRIDPQFTIMDVIQPDWIWLASGHSPNLAYGRIDTILANVNILKNKKQYTLLSNYPNPFNSYTIIQFSIRTAYRIKLGIFNLKGQMIQSLADEYYLPGTYSFAWNGKNENSKHVGNGVYIARLQYNTNQIETRKLLYTK